MRHKNKPDTKNEPKIKDEPDLEGEPDFAEEHTPSATDPPIARPDDGNPDERWDKPTEV